MKANGIETVVDATPVGLGRDVRGLKRASQKTGVNIIATTGWWGMEPPLRRIYSGGKNGRQAFADDINKGCDGTDIKAGILKAAMDKEGPTPWNIKTHHAVGMAQIETGKRSCFIPTALRRLPDIS